MAENFVSRRRNGEAVKRNLRPKNRKTDELSPKMTIFSTVAHRHIKVVIMTDLGQRQKSA